jgi:DNA-binding IclR family transcriptional regulator
MSAETSQTLARGLRVLELLAERPRGTSVAELAEQLGVGRTVAYRLVATLVEQRFAHKDADGQVRLGWGALVLARSAWPLLRAQALPVLRELADAVGATAHLTLAEGDEALAIAVVEPRWTDFHVGYREGSRHSLSQGAAGRAILAAREGIAGPVRSSGELQPGAFGLAIALPPPAGSSPATPSKDSAMGHAGASVVELSIGVVSLAPIPGAAEAAVTSAARSLHRRLFG